MSYSGPDQISLPVASLRRVSGSAQFMDFETSSAKTVPPSDNLYLVIEGLQQKLKVANSEIGTLGVKVEELNDKLTQKQCKILKLVKKNVDLQRKIADLEGKLLLKYQVDFC